MQFKSPQPVLYRTVESKKKTKHVLKVKTFFLLKKGVAAQLEKIPTTLLFRLKP